MNCEDLADALTLECLVPDSEHLVQEQDVSIDVDGDRKAEAHVHPGRVGTHGQVDEAFELGEGHDLIDPLSDVSGA